MDKLVVYSLTTGAPLVELDLGGDTSVPLTYKVADVRDPGKKSGGFSKTVELPGTEVNNVFFGGHYDVNVDTGVFNPNVKTLIVYTTANEEVIDGHMQLKTVKKDDQGDISYGVVLYDKAVDFWQNLKDKTVVGNDDPVDDLDFSDMDHVWDKTQMELSWDTDHDLLGYYYGLYNSGSKHKVEFEEMRPGIFHKRLLTKILDKHGFTGSGSLFTDTTYEREIIPYTGELPEISLADAQAKTFKAGRISDEIIHFDATSSFIKQGQLGITLDNETDTGFGFDDSNGLWNQIDEFTAPVTGLYKLSHLFKFRTTLEWQKTSNTLGILKHSTKFEVFARVFDGANVLQFETLPQPAGQTDIPFSLGPSGDPIAAPIFDSFETAVLQSTQHTVFRNGVTKPFFSLNAGWTVRFFVIASSQGVLNSITNAPSTFTQFQFTDITLELVAGSYVESVLYPYSVGEHSLIPYSQWMSPDLKQKDAIDDIIKRYHCYVFPNPDDPNDIVFETGQTFFTGGIVVDWSAKKDHNTRDQIEQIGVLQSKQLLLSYTPAKDELNEDYKTNTGEIWGQFEHTFGNEFVKGIKKVQTPFEPTPLVHRDGLIVSDINTNSQNIGTRVLYAPKGLTFSGWFAGNDDDYFQVVGHNFLTNAEELTIYDNSFTGAGTQILYPYAGHLNSPTYFTSTQAVIDINFGQVQQYYYEMQDIALPQPTVNMHSVYWKDYVDQLTNGKLQKSKFDLSSFDMALFRRNPNMRVWVDNAYWLINKITFEGNDNLRGLTSVELVTLDNVTVATKPIKPIRPIVGIIGEILPFKDRNKVYTTSPTWTIAGEGNIIEAGATNVNINGNGNTVGPDARFVSIMGGSGNTVRGSNVTIINSDNLVVTSDDLTIIENVIVSGGANTPLFNLIDGGENELRNPFPRFSMLHVEGGLNTLMNPFAVSPVKSIDTTNGINEFL